MNLSDFEEALAAIIGKPTELRPFVCDGSPLACSVFLVGYNPATAMRSGFWDFWTDQGFKRDAWLDAYARERALMPLKPGMKSRPTVSPSRRVIEWIIEGAGIPVLETNLYARPSADMKSLKERDLAPFRFLLDTIRPRVIVAHGKPAHEALEALSPRAEVLAVPHFSRGWSKKRALDLGFLALELAQGR
jgi:hypothetical protein